VAPGHGGVVDGDRMSAEALPAEEDLSLLCVAVAGAMNAAVRERIASDGHGDLRDSHGYVFQHLLAGAVSVGELAERLGVTQQAVSKTANELEALGYVRRAPDASDRRVRRLELTDRAVDAVASARRARRAVNAELQEVLGDRRWSTLLESLRAAAEPIGALDALRTRRLRPPR
jgi:DNA-binding MarR family transcriptional regulator